MVKANLKVQLALETLLLVLFFVYLGFLLLLISFTLLIICMNSMKEDFGHKHEESSMNNFL